MRQYLLYSFSTHFLLFVFLFVLSKNSFSIKKPQIYFIDFIGPSKVVTVGAQADQTPAKIATVLKTEDADLKTGSKSEPLPKPSLLGDSNRLFSQNKPEQPKAGQTEQSNGNPITADFSNFPYPWYITQVREALWNAWMEKMPGSGGLKCVVKFEILKDGKIKAPSIEKSSGNRLFDYAALSSAENAAPFPPLPDDFFEEKLVVHVEFKTME